MKKGDAIVLFILLMIGIAGCILMIVTQRSGAYVVISVDGKNESTYSLNEDREITIVTETEGINTIKIENGVVFMESANCPNQDCVRHVPISLSHESIICLPHRVVVRICSEESTGENDAMVY